MTLFGDPAVWLPLAFATLMGLSILIYVILDGFDLGVGVLFPFTTEAERDRMVASIGPFWDANETWLVLAIGLLLVAFPAAHGTILSALYLPVFVLMVGLVLRGVAFEFRAKAPAARKGAWDAVFFGGSLMSALSQGFMLGLYVMGLEYRLSTVLFSMVTALCLAAAYAFIGAAWLMIKTSGDLQRKAAFWARRGLAGYVVGLGLVSLGSPLVSGRIFDKWFSFPEIFLLAPLPLVSIAVIAGLWVALRHLPDAHDRWSWTPFAGAVVLFVLAFAGLAYSFYPFVVPEKMTIYEAASAPESLFIIFVGTCVVLPTILAYTAMAYTIFRGKATELRYG
ncbi:MAG TPA: cytochrome d ubiquinol oxidase subunit II [Pseudomonadales bacterium]|nr:cytochrome d ubiquinol oxidase subunit II [Pseudomonadales bacterium]